MRFTEVLKTFCHTFIRKKVKAKPEGNTKVTKEPEAVEEKDNYRGYLEREIRRYRAYAYHHRKKRTRKKYLKRLLEVSPIDRLIYTVNQGGIDLNAAWSNGHIIGVDCSARKDFSPGYIGSRKIDHGDSRMEGGIR